MGKIPTTNDTVASNDVPLMQQGGASAFVTPVYNAGAAWGEAARVGSIIQKGATRQAHINNEIEVTNHMNAANAEMNNFVETASKTSTKNAMGNYVTSAKDSFENRLASIDNPVVREKVRARQQALFNAKSPVVNSEVMGRQKTEQLAGWQIRREGLATEFQKNLQDPFRRLFAVSELSVGLQDLSEELGTSSLFPDENTRALAQKEMMQKGYSGALDQLVEVASVGDDWESRTAAVRDIKMVLAFADKEFIEGRVELENTVRRLEAEIITGTAGTIARKITTIKEKEGAASRPPGEATSVLGELLPLYKDGQGLTDLEAHDAIQADWTDIVVERGIASGFNSRKEINEFVKSRKEEGLASKYVVDLNSEAVETAIENRYNSLAKADLKDAQETFSNHLEANGNISQADFTRLIELSMTNPLLYKDYSNGDIFDLMVLPTLERYAANINDPGSREAAHSIIEAARGDGLTKDSVHPNMLSTKGEDINTKLENYEDALRGRLTEAKIIIAAIKSGVSVKDFAYEAGIDVASVRKSLNTHLNDPTVSSAEKKELGNNLAQENIILGWHKEQFNYLNEQKASSMADFNAWYEQLIEWDDSNPDALKQITGMTVSASLDNSSKYMAYLVTYAEPGEVALIGEILNENSQIEGAAYKAFELTTSIARDTIPAESGELEILLSRLGSGIRENIRKYTAGTGGDAFTADELEILPALSFHIAAASNGEIIDAENANDIIGRGILAWGTAYNQSNINVLGSSSGISHRNMRKSGASRKTIGNIAADLSSHVRVEPPFTPVVPMSFNMAGNPPLPPAVAPPSNSAIINTHNDIINMSSLDNPEVDYRHGFHMNANELPEDLQGNGDVIVFPVYEGGRSEGEYISGFMVLYENADGSFDPIRGTTDGLVSVIDTDNAQQNSITGFNRTEAQALHMFFTEAALTSTDDRARSTSSRNFTTNDHIILLEAQYEYQYGVAPTQEQLIEFAKEFNAANQSTPATPNTP